MSSAGRHERPVLDRPRNVGHTDRGAWSDGLRAWPSTRELALPVLVAQGQVPALLEFVGKMQAFLPGGGAAVAAGEGARTLPEAAVGPFVEMDRGAEDRVSRRGRLPRPEMGELCKDCERVVRNGSRGQAFA